MVNDVAADIVVVAGARDDDVTAAARDAISDDIVVILTVDELVGSVGCGDVTTADAEVDGHVFVVV